jgi:hypothetical protein
MLLVAGILQKQLWKTRGEQIAILRYDGWQEIWGGFGFIVRSFHT